ncbi:MAG: ORF6N domain-containing protein [Rhodospirillales bacterium]|nr:ORF6N domain-containing protein [Rhodospirillales bacterium]
MAERARVLQTVIPVERIAAAIYLIRGEKMMLDSDLAELYEVETKRLNEQVKRNSERFPEHFMFQLTHEEFENLKSQIATSSEWGGRRTPPYAFTEHGALMLSSVLKSEHAVRVSIAIVDTFVHMRRLLSTNEALARKVAQHDRQIANLYEHVERLLKWPEPEKKPIGYNEQPRPKRRGIGYFVIPTDRKGVEESYSLTKGKDPSTLLGMTKRKTPHPLRQRLRGESGGELNPKEIKHKERKNA